MTDWPASSGCGSSEIPLTIGAVLPITISPKSVFPLVWLSFAVTVQRTVSPPTKPLARDEPVAPASRVLLMRQA